MIKEKNSILQEVDKDGKMEVDKDAVFLSFSGVQPTSASTSIQDAKQKAKTRARKRKKEMLKKMNDAITEIKMAPHKPRKSTPEQDSEDEDMIEYNPDEFDPDDYVQKYYNTSTSRYPPASLGISRCCIYVYCLHIY
ncbi:hypothetical protein TNCV_887261 [Trichonephila clavipes]|uniref:Uncharacterized protein n=1 Tax=Trichonephila clavipes TaxID=2585209 RepID=A0A8X6UW49_TRICX|nr:hypothetical protein TNCV_887261 [Trichonephila clavipes]